MPEFHVHPVSSVQVFSDDLPVAVEKLAKAIRSVFRRPENLLKGDQTFWIPERLPFWDACWETSPGVSIYFIKSRNWDLANFELLQTVLLRYPNVGRVTTIRVTDSAACIRVNLSSLGYIYIFQSPKPFPLSDLNQFWKLVAPTLGISELYESNEHGPCFRPRMQQSGHEPEVQFKAEGWNNRLYLGPFPSFADGIASYNRLANLLDKEMKPAKFAVTLQPEVAEVHQLIEECRQQSSEWSIEFFGEYRKKFDPYDTPNNPDGYGFYPVLSQRPDGKFLGIQVSVEHAKGKSWLVLHSEAGEELLLSVIKLAELDAADAP